jgi:hypothetical protein
LDALPPEPPAEYRNAPGDIYPRGPREVALCDTASHPDWLYLGALVALDVGGIWAGASGPIKFSDSLPIRFTGPLMIGLTWGATVGGAWLALPKCSGSWVAGPPPEGQVREAWPLTLALALLAGATAPIVNGIAVGFDLPVQWSTFEREMHLVTAGLAGFGGALLPYLIPPRTWVAAGELERIRFGVDGHGNALLQYGFRF